MILLTACSASGNKTTSVGNSGNDQTGGDTVDPTLATDPKALLQPLPKLYTDNLPINDPQQFGLVFSLNSTATSHLYLAYSKGNPAIKFTLPDTIPTILAPLFNDGNGAYHNIVGLGGSKNNTAGNTSDPLHSKLFTLIAGDKTINFGYFTVNGATKIYSYDPANNKIGDYEAQVTTYDADILPNTQNYKLTIYPVSGTVGAMIINVFARQ